MNSTPRVAQLETSLLELGTEIYRLKHEFAEVAEFKEEFQTTLRALRQLLDEKGVINAEDFETAIGMIDSPEMPPQIGDFHSDLLEMERKKFSH
jgi:regulator of replication initiation timing